MMILIGITLLLAGARANPAPQESSAVKADQPQVEDQCKNLTNCLSCLEDLSLGCKYLVFNASNRICINSNGTINENDLEAYGNGDELMETIEAKEACQEFQDQEETTVPAGFSTSLTPEETTTTSTSTTTSTTSTTSPSTTSTISSTSTSTETTTSSASTTNKPSPTTTKAASTTSIPMPTSSAPVDPSGKGGSQFDGWSFFGGIILTLGLASIGFVSYKYYKVRSGTGGNYNRF